MCAGPGNLIPPETGMAARRFSMRRTKLERSPFRPDVLAQSMEVGCVAVPFRFGETGSLGPTYPFVVYRRIQPTQVFRRS